MTIWMIWIGDDGFHWLDSAWDEETISENGEGWELAKKKAYDQWGAEKVRVVKADVNFDKVIEAFNAPDVSA